MLISLRALHDLDYNGTVIPAGTIFDAPAVAAAVMRYQRKVEFAPPGHPVYVPAPPAEPPEPPRRTRRRTDETADNGGETTEPTRRTRRTYRRRDVTAEP